MPHLCGHICYIYVAYICSGICHIYVDLVRAVHCTLCTIHGTLYSVHCAPHTVHCTLCTIHGTLYSLHCALYTVHCTLCTRHGTLYSVHYTAGFLRCLQKLTQNCGLKPNLWNSIPRVFFRFAPMGNLKKTSFARNWTTFVNPAFSAT